MGGSIGLFSLITMLAFLILAPIALIVEGVRFTPDAIRAAGVADPLQLAGCAAIAAATFHLYQQVSYMILSRVSPVTHSIGNCVKRCDFGVRSARQLSAARAPSPAHFHLSAAHSASARRC